MSFFVKVLINLSHSKFRFVKKRILKSFLYNYLPDDEAVKLDYNVKRKRNCNLENPQRFTEKIQWLKLNDRKDIYTTMVDKYNAKKYIADIIGEEYIIPTLGLYSSFEEIDFSKLPDKFVLKTTHSSGDVNICKDKSKFNYNKARKILTKALNFDYSIEQREWPYKNVPRKIIAEKLLENSNDSEIRDYKFYCFNGSVEYYRITSDNKANFYDKNSNFLDFGYACTSHRNENLILPDNINKMIELAETLSKGFIFLRVDFYNIDGKIYAGELTLYPAGGTGKFEPDEYDFIWGNLLKLPID